ncbi:MAG: hypothetical protein MUF07_11105, partial [Steroidobacteraceae bacterium]|nr:hypothetical protein [Steroidobacteraceae bacterium]
MFAFFAPTWSSRRHQDGHGLTPSVQRLQLTQAKIEVGIFDAAIVKVHPSGMVAPEQVNCKLSVRRAAAAPNDVQKVAASDRCAPGLSFSERAGRRRENERCCDGSQSRPLSASSRCTPKRGDETPQLALDRRLEPVVAPTLIEPNSSDPRGPTHLRTLRQSETAVDRLH